MTEGLILASGLGRAMDAAFVQMVLFFGCAVSAVWLYSMWKRSRVKLAERFAFAAFWVGVIALSVWVWEGGRIADERHHREAFPEVYSEKPISN
jgi:hypothetical protein